MFVFCCFCIVWVTVSQLFVVLSFTRDLYNRICVIVLSSIVSNIASTALASIQWLLLFLSGGLDRFALIYIPFAFVTTIERIETLVYLIFYCL